MSVCRVRVCAREGQSGGMPMKWHVKGERDGCPDVMWHQLPLCHFVFPGGGFRGWAKRCLPLLPNTKANPNSGPPPHPHQTHTNTHRDVAAVFSKPNVPMRAKRLVFVFELCLELSHIRRRLRTAFHFSLFCFCRTIQMFQEGLRAWTTLRTRDSLQPGPPLSSFCLTLSFLFLFLFSSLPPPLLSASLSLAGDQRSFIIGAAMAASLLTAPFKLQAPLLSINSALPQTSCGHWQAETVFMTLFVSKWKWGVLAHLYLQLLNHLHLDSALSSAAVI